MNPAQHAVIRASAGTGKTHALAMRFLTLLFGGVSPERVLATTFTKKAAGEILERVFQRLVHAARDPLELEGLVKDLGPAGIDVTSQSCEALVAGLARQMDRFQVRTLDSFFARIARLYAYELGLSPDWRIADEAELAEQSEESVGQLLLEEDSPEGRSAILELLRELQGSNPGNSVTRSLMGTVGTGLDVWCEAEHEAWDRIQLPPGISDAQIETILLEYEQHSIPTTAKGKPNGHWQKARTSDIESARRGSWAKLLSTGLTGKVQAGEDLFSKHPICDELCALLEPLLRHARRQVLNEVVRRNLAARALLRRYSSQLHRIQRDSGVLGFGDVPRAIAPTHDDEPLSERELDMWFRLDGRVDHLLLDEFQDTSTVQWRILRRLAEEILSEVAGERSFFCVGDEKQSIYGFRHAEPRLLQQLHELPFVEAGELRHSYRSAQVILDSINRVFQTIHTSSAILGVGGPDGDAVCAGAREFATGYTAHESARADLDGATLMVEPQTDGELQENGPSADEVVLELAAQRVAALVEHAPSASIGVLYRTREQIPRLLRRLDALGVTASGEGGNPLTDCRAVVEVLALLHFADHPGDTAAAFHSVRAGLGTRYGLTFDSSKEEREAAGLNLRGELYDLGLGGFLTGLESHFACSYPDAWQRGRYRQLIELAHGFDERGPGRPGAFVRHVRRTRVESSTPAQVKVMTIHGSKGLQFDAVVLPQLDKPVLGRNPSFLVHRPAPDGPIQAVSYCPNKDIRAISADLQELWRGHVERGLRESLCLLYVALTRSARRLELIVAPQDSNDPPNSLAKLTWSSILRSTLIDEVADESNSIPGARILYRSESGGPQAWSRGKEQAPSNRSNDAPPIQLPKGLGLAAKPATQITSASQEIDASQVPLASSSHPRLEVRRLGVLIHRLLEQVEWLEDFHSSDGELEACLLPLEADAELRAQALQRFRVALETAPFQSALSRSKNPDIHTLWRERRFFVKVEGGPAAGRWVQGAMDRVHLYGAGDQPQSAVIFDFKSGVATDKAEIAHTRQLETYAHVLATQWSLDPGVIQTQTLSLGSS